MNFPKPNGIITLTTDFGLEDGYVGAMKGIILSIYPEAKIIDVSHYIKPQNLLHSAYVLASSIIYYPKGTIHIVVVDPGVGSKRKPIILVSDKYYFIGPDNGILYWVIKKTGKYIAGFEIKPHLWSQKEVSTTFHGRDIFAPCAALLLKEKDLSKISEPLADEPILLNFPEPIFKKDLIIGEIIVIDHFGNAITNIYKKEFVKNYGSNIKIKEVKIINKNIKVKKYVQYYSQLNIGEEGFLWNSENYLELTVREGSFSQRFDLKVGDKIEIRLC